MVEIYWRDGIYEKKVIFEFFFRRFLFENGYVVFVGLEKVIEYLENFKFMDSDLNYLQEEFGYYEDFIEYLCGLIFIGLFYFMKEGEFVFNNELIMRVEVFFVEVQLIEMVLFNIVNY